MKFNRQNFLKAILLSCSLLFLMISITGCSYVYNISDYQSKDEFYKKVNEDIQGENIILRIKTPDTSFQAQDAAIRNDAMYMTTLKKWLNKHIKKSDIKSAAYYNKSYDNLCAKLELRNGDCFAAEYIVINADSTLDFKYLLIVSAKIPVYAIKNISYKNNRGPVAGFGYGLLTGALTGFGLALMVNNQIEHPSGIWSEPGNYSPAGIWFAAALIAGPIIGTPVGWIIGGRTTREFCK